MDTEELKKLVKNSTTVLVLDSGEPSFVILNYNTYKDLVLGEPVKEVKITSPHSQAGHVGNGNAAPVSNNGSSHDEPKTTEFLDRLKHGQETTPRDVEVEVLERINKDILALKEEIEKEEKMLSID